MNITAAHELKTGITGRPVGRTAQRVSMASLVEVATIIVLAAAVVVAIGISADRTPSVEQTTTIRVEAGDTLWEIATTHPVPGASTRDSVATIGELNDLRDSDLRVGQVLKVPAAPTPDVALAAR